MLVYGSYQHRDFTRCSACNKPFGFRSDSTFCNVECQTKSVDRLDGKRYGSFSQKRHNVESEYGKYAGVLK